MTSTAPGIVAALVAQRDRGVPLQIIADCIEVVQTWPEDEHQYLVAAKMLACLRRRRTANPAGACDQWLLDQARQLWDSTTEELSIHGIHLARRAKEIIEAIPRQASQRQTAQSMEDSQ